MNTYYENGAATSKNPGNPPPPNSNNFGIGLIGASQGNQVESNKFRGNVNGVYITNGIGNIIRHNIIAGNPPVQVSKDYGKAIGADIQVEAPAGANNTFDGNYCLTYAGPEPSPCPNLGFLLSGGPARLLNAAFHLNGPLGGYPLRAVVPRNWCVRGGWTLGSHWYRMGWAAFWVFLGAGIVTGMTAVLKVMVGGLSGR